MAVVPCPSGADPRARRRPFHLARHAVPRIDRHQRLERRDRARDTRDAAPGSPARRCSSSSPARRGAAAGTTCRSAEAGDAIVVPPGVPVRARPGGDETAARALLPAGRWPGAARRTASRSRRRGRSEPAAGAAGPAVRDGLPAARRRAARAAGRAGLVRRPAGLRVRPAGPARRPGVAAGPARRARARASRRCPSWSTPWSRRATWSGSPIPATPGPSASSSPRAGSALLADVEEIWADLEGTG